MYIIDITKYIDKEINNYYCFNNSLIHLRDDIYLMSYRIIYYKLDTKIHPWAIWWDGYNIFCSRCPEIENTAIIIGQKKQFNIAKYRNKLNNDILHKFDSKFIDKINYDLLEFDGTGLALIEIKDKKINILKNMNNIFGSEMNQDARLVKKNDEIYITYNAYMLNNNDVIVSMLQRRVYIEDDILYLGNESYMSTIINKPIEKNWIIFNQDILYSINGKFEIIKNNKILSYEIPAIKYLINKYKEIYFSLSTQCLEYDNNKYISVGHLKIDYRNNYEGTEFGNFLTRINFNNNTTIRKHGKYIYFMFLFVFTNNYVITHISDAFIPSMNANHLPYLLVFPIGFEKKNNEYIISYGEGDERSKILYLQVNELNDMLRPVENKTEHEMAFNILDKKKKILALGYYDKYNTGDECYKIAFNKLLNSSEVIYKNPYEIDKIDSNYDLIICGGGNLLNEYFINKIKELINKKIKVIAFSVDIPYTEIINESFLDFFDEIYVRNYTDASVLRNKKYSNIVSVPDAVFIFDRPILNKNKKNLIGFCLTRTIYNVNCEKDYVILISKFSRLIKKLMVNYEVCLIPFCINPNNNKENDIILNNQLKDITGCSDISDYISIEKTKYPHELFNFFGNLIHTICMRYHAHIFSIIHGISFTSLATTRKCRLLLQENDLMDNHFELEINKKYQNPINLNENECYNKIIKNINTDISEKLTNIYNKNRKELMELQF